MSLTSSALACWFFTTSTTWETYIYEMESLCCTAEINIVYQLFDVQSLSCIRLFATLWSAAHLASLSFTIYWSLLKFMPIELVMLSNHLILCHPLLFCLQSFLESGYFPMSWLFTLGGQSIGTSASASVLPMNTQDGFPLKLTNWSCSQGNSRPSSPAPQYKNINSSVLSLFYGPTLISMHDYWKKS